MSIIPFNIVNKTIVYSDTVLPLKEIGENLKVTSISDVSEFELENCLKEIFNSNKNVKFNTVQYSKKDKTVYFYANRELSTEEYKESKFNTYKPLTGNQKILNEVKNVLTNPIYNNGSIISLFDVSVFFKKMYDQFEKEIKKHEDLLDNLISEKLGYTNYLFSVGDFDYKTKEIRIHFNYSRGELSDFKEIRFSKKDGDIYISKSECLWDEELFSVMANELSVLYDVFMKYEKYYTESSVYEINSVNSNFLVNISRFGSCIKMNDNFRLDSLSYKDKYSFDCNSGIVLSAIKDNEDKIFKKVYVNISDCPEWSRPYLYQTVQYEAYKHKKNKERKLRQERNKEKVLEFKKKIFPWMK